jgi:hypothetical protein
VNAGAGACGAIRFAGFGRARGAAAGASSHPNIDDATVANPARDRATMLRLEARSRPGLSSFCEINHK